MERSTRTRKTGVYVVIVLEKLDALLMSGLWVGPPKSPHIEELVLPKPVAVIPHQGNRRLTRARMPAATPRKFARGRVVTNDLFPSNSWYVDRLFGY